MAVTEYLVLGTYGFRNLARFLSVPIEFCTVAVSPYRCWDIAVNHGHFLSVLPLQLFMQQASYQGALNLP